MSEEEVDTNTRPDAVNFVMTNITKASSQLQVELDKLREALQRVNDDALDGQEIGENLETLIQSLGDLIIQLSFVYLRERR